MEIVKKIIEEVNKNGDAAVRKYTEIFDKIKLDNFRVSKKEIKEAYEQADKATITTIKKAAFNIERFARAQLKQFKDFEYRRNGIIVGQRIIPIEKIGVYAPGGRYPLPSTALMCIIPAKVAGVKEIIVCSPKIKPITIVAADLARADLIFNIGGVQAIAAMAYGTKTVPKVDKIVGPGNIYVTQAKKEVFGDCGIDLLAGPSEILIIGDNSSNHRFIAADLLAQAEHDASAKTFLVTNSKNLIKKVDEELKTQIKTLKTRNVIKEALKGLKTILVKNIEEAIETANKIAPEHLSLQVKNLYPVSPALFGKRAGSNGARKYLNQLKNYGSLSLGGYSAVVFGDYCSGPNHVLPTDTTSRYTGGLSVKDFLKIQTYQYLSKEGAKKLVQVAAKFASIEGLDAHRKSAEIRLK